MGRQVQGLFECQGVVVVSGHWDWQTQRLL